MDWMVVLGALVTLGGLGLLVYCILTVARARKAGLPEEELRSRLRRVVAINLAALFISSIGLMMVIVGLFLS
jgi:hypothetical protein